MKRNILNIVNKERIKAIFEHVRAIRNIMNAMGYPSKYISLAIVNGRIMVNNSPREDKDEYFSAWQFTETEKIHLSTREKEEEL